eukprot:5501778-Amphidinium_carterae.1
MQEPLKRVGTTVQAGGAGGVMDWRRRQALGAQDVIKNILAAQKVGQGAGDLAGAAVSSTAPEGTAEAGTLERPNNAESTVQPGQFERLEPQGSFSANQGCEAQGQQPFDASFPSSEGQWHERGLAGEAEAQEVAAEASQGGLLGVQHAHVMDPFAELISTIRAWLEQGQGALRQDAVLPLIAAMGFRVGKVISALSGE